MAASLPSLANLKPNPDWAKVPLFDRKGWKHMAFGDFAESIGERAEPKDAQDEIYVGLEHLDSQCLHIRRWGKGSDVTGTKLRFRKGDIIFGRRRAYLIATEITPDARELAGKHSIGIMDREELIRWIDAALAAENHDVRKALERPEKLCPKCRAKMVQRTARRGKMREGLSGDALDIPNAIKS